MAEDLQEQDALLPFQFDCGLMRRSLLEDEPLPPESPTTNYMTFIRRFRTIAKHPTKVVYDIPVLPSEDEVSAMRLPMVGRGSDTIQNTKFEGTSTAANAKRVSKKSPKILLEVCFLVSWRSEETGEVVLLLYKRVNCYLIAVRDRYKRWWSLTKKGDALFKGARGLGFEENYHQMLRSTEVKVGIMQLKHAFLAFLDPEKSTHELLKKASLVTINITSEAARSKILCDNFDEVFRDPTYSRFVILDPSKWSIITNWKKASGKIIDASGSVEGEKDVEEALLNENQLVVELKNKGVNKIKDSHLAYGLLLAK